jgi:hypothetical protein
MVFEEKAGLAADLTLRRHVVATRLAAPQPFTSARRSPAGDRGPRAAADQIESGAHRPVLPLRKPFVFAEVVARRAEIGELQHRDFSGGKLMATKVGIFLPAQSTA